MIKTYGTNNFINEGINNTPENHAPNLSKENIYNKRKRKTRCEYLVTSNRPKIKNLAERLIYFFFFMLIDANVIFQNRLYFIHFINFRYQHTAYRA